MCVFNLKFNYNIEVKLHFRKLRLCAQCSLSHVHLFVTLWTGALQVSPVHGILQATVLKEIVRCLSCPSHAINVTTDLSENPD